MIPGIYGEMFDGDEFLGGFWDNFPGLAGPQPPPAPQLWPMQHPQVLPHRAPAPAAAAIQADAAPAVAPERPVNRRTAAIRLPFVRNRVGQVGLLENPLNAPAPRLNYPPAAILNLQQYLQQQQQQQPQPQPPAPRAPPPIRPQRRDSHFTANPAVQPVQNQNQGQEQAQNQVMDNAQVQQRLEELAQQEQDFRQQLLMAQQQRIVDHAERRVQRKQYMARLRMEEEAEEEAVARALGDLRREFPGQVQGQQQQGAAGNGAQVGRGVAPLQDLNQILRESGSRKGR
jgi:hypothetical protein